MQTLEPSNLLKDYSNTLRCLPLLKKEDNISQHQWTVEQCRRQPNVEELGQKRLGEVIEARQLEPEAGIVERD